VQRVAAEALPACHTEKMAALSALVFSLSWWLGLYLLARNPRKPVLAFSAVGLCSFAMAVALDAVRLVTHSRLLGHIEIYLVAVPGVAWFAVLLELARPRDGERSRTGEALLVGVVAALTLLGATLAGRVDGPLRIGHVVMCGVISLSTLGAMIAALRSRAQKIPVVGLIITATMFFALANAILVIPLAVVPSWLALASTGCDVFCLGLAVALWDAFDEGHALRADMLRSFTGTGTVVALIGGQMLIAIELTRRQSTAQIALTVLLFTSLAIAASVQVLADPLAGLLDRLVFSRAPLLRADRETLRRTQSALPLRLADPLDGFDDDTFARLGHYGDLSKLVANPLTALPAIDERLAARGAPDQPLERAIELKALLADRIAALKPRDGGDFGTSEQWRHYNSLYFPYVVGVRAYAQNATAAGLDPTARQAWQWFVTDVPQRSLHNWQNAAAKLIAADLRGRVSVSS
jgi:hypothetical protein